jgi:hypothetical protein
MNNDRFGSLLKNNIDVLRQSQIYPVISTSLWWNDTTIYRELPNKFDGRDAWQGFICLPAIQRCSDSWCVVARDILADRFTLCTGGQLLLQLSETEIIACINKNPIENANTKDHCEGYSIYDAWEYIYANGLPQNNCFSHRKLTDLNVPLPENIPFVEKEKIYGNNCSIIEKDKTECIWKKNGLPVARRSFYCSSIMNVTQYDQNRIFDLSKSIETIKYELIRFGPVAGGFLVYENFTQDYDGTTIYKEAKGKPLGGHYVSIMGWNNKDGVEYWICRNSYGTDWGLTGYFYIKIGIKECMLEENVSTVSPFFYNLATIKYPTDSILHGKMVDQTNMKLINPELYMKRKNLDVDVKTFYTKDVLELIKKGKLYGELEPLIDQPEKLIPNIELYWVQDFKNFLFVTLEYEKDNRLSQKSESNIIEIILFLCFCILAFFIGFRKF